MRIERAPLGRSVAQVPDLDRFFAYAAALKILLRFRIFLKLFFEEALSNFEHFENFLLLRTFDTALWRVPLELDTRFVGENFERLLELQSFSLFDEGEDVSLGSATETIIALTRRRNEKRRGLLTMEWATTF